jgi:hypothetical protein
MAWHIVAAHHVAQLQPTLTAGTASTGFAYGNARTLQINQRASITPHASNGVKLDFNRGGTGAALNCILILQNSMSGGNWNVISDDNSGFSSATTLIAATSSPSVDIYKRFDASATSTEQYLRFHYNQTSGGPYEFGVISFGVAFQTFSKVQLQSENINAEPLGGTHFGDGFRRWTRSFLVTRANSETILSYASRYYVNNSANTLIDAFGGGGGRNPIAVVDDSTSPATVYWGPASVSARPHSVAFNEVFVEMDVLNRGLF